jgi:hypothetical protein
MPPRRAPLLAPAAAVARPLRGGRAAPLTPPRAQQRQGPRSSGGRQQWGLSGPTAGPNGKASRRRRRVLLQAAAPHGRAAAAPAEAARPAAAAAAGCSCWRWSGTRRWASTLPPRGAARTSAPRLRELARRGSRSGRRPRPAATMGRLHLWPQPPRLRPRARQQRGRGAAVIAGQSPKPTCGPRRLPARLQLQPLCRASGCQYCLQSLARGGSAAAAARVWRWAAAAARGCSRRQQGRAPGCSGARVTASCWRVTAPAVAALTMAAAELAGMAAGRALLSCSRLPALRAQRAVARPQSCWRCCMRCAGAAQPRRPQPPPQPRRRQRRRTRAPASALRAAALSPRRGRPSPALRRRSRRPAAAPRCSAPRTSTPWGR